MWGDGRKTQAGGRVPARSAGIVGVQSNRDRARAAGEASARMASPGRLKTAIGTEAAIALPAAPAMKTGEIVGAHHPHAGRRRAGAAASRARVSAV